MGLKRLIVRFALRVAIVLENHPKFERGDVENGEMRRICSYTGTGLRRVSTEKKFMREGRLSTCPTGSYGRVVAA